MTKLISSVSKRQVEFAAKGVVRGSGSAEIVRSKNISTKLSYQGNGWQQGTGGPYNCVFDGTHFVGILSRGGGSGSSYSTNGLNWTNGGTNGISQWWDSSSPITDGKGTVLAVLDWQPLNAVRKSTDHGVTWSATADLPVAGGLNSIGYVNGDRWLANIGTTVFHSLDNCVSWQIIGTAPVSLANVTYGKGILIGVTNSTTGYYSLDYGTTWTTCDTVAGRGQVVYSNKHGIFLAGQDWQGQVSYSYNARNWSAIDAWEANATYWGIVNDLLILYRGRIFDPSSISFKRFDSSIIPQAYGNGVYVRCAYGANPQILSSISIINSRTITY